jgi:hypothetical protein
MSDGQPVPQPPRPLFMQAYPGYWRTKGKLERMERLQDLVRHRERWGGDLELALPIEKLLPHAPENKRHLFLDEEINKLLRVVYWDLHYAGVPTGMEYRSRYADAKQKPRRYDVILDYFRLPREPGSEHGAFEAVMRVLTEGIGVYEARLEAAKREIFNPVVWAAHLIRLPITVMERAGFVGHEKTEELMLGGYVRFVKIMMGVVVTLLALLLGVKVPWKEIVSYVLRWTLG